MQTAWVCAAIAAFALLCVQPAAAQIGIVSVTGGRVEGVTADGVTSFKGIPFAAPPVGNLRWRDPQPVRPWNGIKPADRFAPGCMQDPNFFFKQFGLSPAISEDCLYLNVWTPARSARERLPVMVWIYGGGLAGGATRFPVFDGTRLARKGVVLVSVAYRVGVLGFLADPELSAESRRHVSGNYGLHDMIAALEWVNANIARFGGDPSRVTIFGESAGGDAVGMLAQSSLARGLFERGIAESGSTFYLGGEDFTTLQRAAEAGQRFLAKLGVTSIAAARRLDAQVLLTAQGPWGVAGSFEPRVVESDAFPGEAAGLIGYPRYQTHRFNDTPVLAGSNADEGSLFVPAHTSPSQFEAQVRAQFGPFAGRVLAVYPHATDSESSRAALDLFRDTEMVWGAWTWAKLQSEDGQGKAYLYYFDRRSPQAPLGPAHTAEVGYVFDNLTAPGLPTRLTSPPGPADVALSDLMQSYWVNFAKTGDPNGPGLPHWPAFQATSPRTMLLDEHPGAHPVPGVRQMKIFDAYFQWLRKEAKKKRAK